MCPGTQYEPGGHQWYQYDLWGVCLLGAVRLIVCLQYIYGGFPLGLVVKVLKKGESHVGNIRPLICIHEIASQTPHTTNYKENVILSSQVPWLTSLAQFNLHFTKRDIINTVLAGYVSRPPPGHAFVWMDYLKVNRDNRDNRDRRIMEYRQTSKTSKIYTKNQMFPPRSVPEMTRSGIFWGSPPFHKTDLPVKMPRRPPTGPNIGIFVSPYMEGNIYLYILD